MTFDQLPTMLTKNTQPKSICIIRLSAIGDVCHAIASVQAIRRQWPSVKITWVIGKVEARLVADLADIEFIIFDKKAGIKAYRDLYRALKNKNFDISLHMQVAIRASLATLCIKATEKWGFDRRRAKEGQWLFTNRKISAQEQPHVAEGFWGFTQAIGVKQGERPTWNMPINEAAQIWCDDLFRNLSNEQFDGSRPIFVISPAASKIQRNWLADRYAAIADYASEKGYLVIISGAPTEMERELSEDIIRCSNSSLINLVGQTTLPQLLALVARAKIVLAPDSGPAHMATIVGTPVIGLYAHSNPRRTGPYLSYNTTVSVYEELLQQQTVKTIKDNPWGKRVKGDDLMNLITVEDVISAFNRIDS
jgi:heptosyltransferase I